MFFLHYVLDLMNHYTELLDFSHFKNCISPCYGNDETCSQIQDIRFNPSDDSDILRTQPGLLAKIKLQSVCPDDILVTNLDRTVKCTVFNRLLCPVRALKRYPKMTESILKKSVEASSSLEERS